MIRLGRLTVSHFRSFTGSESVQLPESGLVQLRGQNLNTGGSSASGKSNLFMAIQFVLGGQHAAIKNLQSRHTEEDMQVQLEVGNALVYRGAKTGITVGEKKRTGANALWEELPRVTGLPVNLLAAITNRRQRTGSHLLGLDDSAKKDFLSQVIPDLERFSQLAEDCEKRAAELSARLSTLTTEEAALNAKLEAVAATELELEAMPPSSEVAELQASWQLAHTGMREAERAVQQALTEQSQLRAVPRADFTKAPEVQALLVAELPETKGLDEARATLKSAQEDLESQRQLAEATRRLRHTELTNLQVKLDQVRNVCLSRPRIVMEQKASAEANIRALEAHTCPRCERPWEDPAVQQQLQTARASLEACQTEMAQLVVLARQRDELQVELQKRKEDEKLIPYTPVQAAAAVAAAQKGVDAAAAQLQAAERQRQAAVTKMISDMTLQWEAEHAEQRLAEDATRQQVASLQSQLLEATRLEGQFSAQLKELKTRCLDIKARNDKRRAQHQEQLARRDLLTQTLDSKRNEVQEVKQALDAEQDLAELAGPKGFLSVIFDEILAEISDEANSLLASVPNTSDIAFSFRTDIMSRGARRISPYVSCGGSEAGRPEDELSGGQLSALHLAVDLAVLAVIERRTGTSPGWLLLDEPFEGLGVIEKEAYLELLRRCAQERLVLVVDHGTETSEFFDASITVQRQGNTSRIA